MKLGRGVRLGFDVNIIADLGVDPVCNGEPVMMGVRYDQFFLFRKIKLVVEAVERMVPER